MKRFTLRGFLLVLLTAAAAFTAWTWLRPYEWNEDPAARCKVLGADVRKDHSFFWVDLRLDVRHGQTHDLMKPVRLITSAGRELVPADTTLIGSPEDGTTGLWFKFWLEAADIEGPLSLRINDGVLSVRTRPGMPVLGNSTQKSFSTNQW